MTARWSGHDRTKNFCAFRSRLLCVHVQTIVRSPDHRAFMSRPSCVHVQTIVRSSVFPDRVILNVRHPLRAFISVWTYLVSVWDFSLGDIIQFFHEFILFRQANCSVRLTFQSDHNQQLTHSLRLTNNFLSSLISYDCILKSVIEKVTTLGLKLPDILSNALGFFLDRHRAHPKVDFKIHCLLEIKRRV